MVEQQQPAGGGGDTAVKRKRSLATALASLCKAVNRNWTWRYGVAQSFLLYAVTHSDLALRLLAATGHGAPVNAPQKTLYPQVMKILNNPEMVVEMS